MFCSGTVPEVVDGAIPRWGSLGLTEEAAGGRVPAGGAPWGAGVGRGCEGGAPWLWLAPPPLPP